MPIKSKQKVSTHFLVYPPDKELLPSLIEQTFPESSPCIDPDVRQTAHSFLPDRLSDCKARLWLFRSLGKIIINQFPVAHAIGGEVAAAVCVREVHQERLGTLLVHLTAQLLFQIESVYHVVLGNFASCHRQNSG